MNNKDSAVLKVLAQLGHLEETELTAEQLELLERALDEEKEFLHQVEKLFSKN